MKLFTKLATSKSKIASMRCSINAGNSFEINRHDLRIDMSSGTASIDYFFVCNNKKFQGVLQRAVLDSVFFILESTLKQIEVKDFRISKIQRFIEKSISLKKRQKSMSNKFDLIKKVRKKTKLLCISFLRFINSKKDK